ncbi:MAG: hypothetical protein HYV09_05495 [Deltaproteobacteria bacterium]|nr:hypothetical protein [Deltaproteobacteria bacterium]
MATTNLLTLDRQLALAAKALDAWRGELAVDDRRDDDDPVAPWPDLSSKATIEAIGRSGLAPIPTTPTFLLPEGELITLVAPAHPLDPLAEVRGAMISWCAHLHVARGVRDATVVRAGLARDELESEAYGKKTSLRAMLRALARPRQAGGVPEARASATIEDLSPQLLDGVLEEESRRREAAEILGDKARCCSAVDAGATAEADAFLRATADEADEALAFGLRAAQRATKHPTWVDVFAVRRAADVAEGWPAALSGRWFAELARGTELVAGLDFEVRVDAGRLAPRADHAGLHLAPPTGAWTFARALFALGAALRLHGRDAKVPFAPHAPPHDRRPWVLGEAFLALASTTVFHARARGVARAKAELSARRLATTRLLERRHLALRVRLAAELAKGRRAFLEAFEDLGPKVLGDGPRALAAFLGAPGPLGPADDAARLRSLSEGDALAARLVEVFDADWWRNPKAASFIRDRCSR